MFANICSPILYIACSDMRTVYSTAVKASALPCLICLLRSRPWWSPPCGGCCRQKATTVYRASHRTTAVCRCQTEPGASLSRNPDRCHCHCALVPLVCGSGLVGGTAAGCAGPFHLGMTGCQRMHDFVDPLRGLQTSRRVAEPDQRRDHALFIAET